MDEVNRILDQFRRSWDGDAWHGPPLWKVLDGVSAAVATYRPGPEIHSIAEIILHVTTWHEVGLRRILGEEYNPTETENWQEVTTLSESVWQSSLSQLRRSFESLCVAIGDLSDDQLDSCPVGKNYSNYVLLHGVIQHDLYHAGQIALLRKLPEHAESDPSSVQLIFGASEASACSRLLDIALEEDLGADGDLTSLATIPADRAGRAAIVSRAAGVIAGLPAAALMFRRIDPELKFESHVTDGTVVLAGTRVATVSGRMRSILAGERTALNFVGRLSGVATLTRRFVDAVAGLPTHIIDTRKTTPGWRMLEKYAVRCGGGTNHRMGLDTGILIKDNHVASFGAGPQAVAQAVRKAQAANDSGVPVEVEVDTLEQLDSALAEKPDIVLLDNMTADQLREAVRRRNGVAPAVKLESSGGVTLANVRTVAETGVDRISVGALTHSAPALDVALDYLA